MGAKVGSDLRRDGLSAMLLAWVAILIYVAFRFSALYAPGAVVALVHDVIITSGILVMFNVNSISRSWRPFSRSSATA